MPKRGERGFTLVEITIILLVLMILGAILIPMSSRYIEIARVARATEDVTTIASAIILFLHDTGLPCFLKDGGYAPGGFIGSPPPLLDNNRIDVLWSAGNAPDVATPVGNPGVCSPGADYFGWNGLPPTFDGDLLDNHLALGNPYAAGFITDPNDYYAQPVGFDKQGFRGAYVSTPVQADPWGNRYVVNVAFLHSDGTPTAELFGCGATVGQFLSHDVFVLSAGPDGTINTAFASDGVVAQNDDLIAVISGYGQGIEHP